MPLVVCPTLVLRFNYSNVVPKRALSSVDFPELCDPIIDSV